MRNVVIVGGTRGIGGALAERLRRDGDRVIALGSADADLTRTRETVKLVERLPDVIDVLVFSAGRFNRRRIVTDEGFEQTFSLYVLSRYLLADRLRSALGRSAHPVLLNLCGVGGLRGGSIHWDDPHLATGYSMMTAILQGARANDLLGAGFHDHYPRSPVRYVLYNPLFVDSGLNQNLDQPARAVVGALAGVFGTRPRAIADRLAALLNDPPAEPLTAQRRDRPIPITGPVFDRTEAARLYALLGTFTARAT